MKRPQTTVTTILFLFIFSALKLSGQGTMRVTITESGSAKPIEFVTVFLEGTTFGATTNEKGEALVESITPGTYNVKLSCIGYQPKTIFEIEVTKGKPSVVNAELAPSSTQLAEVEIKANPFVKSEESPVSVRTIGTNEIQRYPGGNRDISKVVQSLPGVGFSTGFRNDLYIRGGSSAENKFYIDGIEIPNINHFATQGSSGGPVGLINVDFVREVNFYSSAFPSNRGNALSSVMDIKLKDGRDDRWGGTFTLGSSEFAASMESPLNKKRSATMLASFRYSYLQFLFKALKLPFLPTYTDAQVKIKWKITDKDELTFVSLSAYDINRLNVNERETEQQRYLLSILPEQNQLSYMVGGKYTHYFKNSFLQVFLSRNMLVNTFGKWEDNDKSKTKITDYKSTESENKLRVEYSGRKKQLRYGVGVNYEYAYYTNSSSFLAVNAVQGVYSVNYKTTLPVHKYGLFANASNTFFNDLVTLTLGVRLDGNSYNPNMANLIKQVSPRFSGSVKLHESVKVNFNTGYYHQLPAYTIMGYRDSLDVLANKDRITYMRCVHAVAGLEYTTGFNSRISVEGFFKRYYNVPYLINDQISLANQGGDFGVVGNAPAISNNQGKTYGLEVLYEQKLYKGFYGIVSYTFFYSKFQDNVGNYVPSSWDTRHIISASGGKKFKKNWELGARMRVQGGSPFTPYDLDKSSDINYYNAQSPGIRDFTNINAERTKWFHALDIRLTKKWYFKKWSFELYLDVQNCYASKSPTPDTFLPITDAQTGAVLTQPDNPQRIQYKLLNTSSGRPLPTLGFVVYY